MKELCWRITALSFNRRGGVCPPEDINLSICGRIRAGKSCPYKYLAKADIHFNILNERAVLADEKLECFVHGFWDKRIG